MTEIDLFLYPVNDVMGIIFVYNLSSGDFVGMKTYQATFFFDG